jgi:hypothetical protein
VRVVGERGKEPSFMVFGENEELLETVSQSFS